MHLHTFAVLIFEVWRNSVEENRCKLGKKNKLAALILGYRLNNVKWIIFFFFLKSSFRVHLVNLPEVIYSEVQNKVNLSHFMVLQVLPVSSL